MAKAASTSACKVTREAESVESTAASRAANKALLSVVNVLRELATTEV